MLNILQCESYNRLLRDAITNEENAPKGDDLEALMDAEGEDDKTYAAMGVAKTLSTVGYQQGPSKAYANNSADRVIHRLFAGDPRSSAGSHYPDHKEHSRE